MSGSLFELPRTLTMDSLSLFSDWKLCSHCGLSPCAQHNQGVTKTKLMICSRCHSAAYHNATCQRAHWISGHKYDCKKLNDAIKPLTEFMQWRHCDIDMNYISWMSNDMMNEFLTDKYNNVWQHGVTKWNDGNYLEALGIFQRYLSPYKKAWYSNANKHSKHVGEYADEQLFCDKALQLARRLLFCAYCELDGNQIDSARQNLVQCLSLLITIQSLPSSSNKEVRATLDDAWMELTLSMEEVPSDRIIARHVAQMAIATKSCGWNDPFQRPGFMANTPLDGMPFITRELHPPWCKTIETNWNHILKEYKSLAKYNSYEWHDVGSGERGSGHDDHRVVTGNSWKEYVLFGSGSSVHDSDAPITKELIRKHIPDAVSLALMGGGEVIFSRLQGGTHINSHCGTTNIRWTAHLGLIVPQSESDCRIRVADEWHNWKAGQVMLFDDSFEHEVINDTNEERVVLLIRLWHPQLEKEQRIEALTEAMKKKEESVDKRYHSPM